MMRLIFSGLFVSLLLVGCTSYQLTSATAVNNDIYATVIKRVPGTPPQSVVARCQDTGTGLNCGKVSVQHN